MECLESAPQLSLACFAFERRKPAFFLAISASLT